MNNFIVLHHTIVINSYRKCNKFFWNIFLGICWEIHQKIILNRDDVAATLMIQIRTIFIKHGIEIYIVISLSVGVKKIGNEFQNRWTDISLISTIVETCFYFSINSLKRKIRLFGLLIEYSDNINKTIWTIV